MRHHQVPKFLLTLLLLPLLSCSQEEAGRISTRPAAEVIYSFIGRQPDNISLQIDPRMEKDGRDAYSWKVRKGHLKLKASSQVALCKGFYDFSLSHGYGVMTWSGTRCQWPEKLPKTKSRKVQSPFRNHLFYNVCTYGYSTAYWTWEEWSKEIDWLALHGFDMPLAPIAGEAIMAKVWKKMGLDDEEINAYFTGPGHFPWMRMGNMTGLDGAPSEAWHESQIQLQHLIIDKMRSLDMEPVFQGFAGFVPKAMKEHYPDIDLMTTDWSGFESYMLSPVDSLFTQIQKNFITEWEKEFGPGKYYLVDSFNELDIPFGEQGSPERAELLKKYSSTIYNSLTAANPQAIWVMQGWMFGYQRDIWDPESIAALLSGVPDDKLIIIDLAVDFNRFIWQNRKSWEYIPGMCGKQWIYSTTPNFGGRTALIGNLESYMNGHLEALDQPESTTLTGFGASPEGIEQNEILYEVLSDAAWRSHKADLQSFLRNYSKARYGSCPESMEKFWQEITKGPYAHCTNNAKYLWQQRPIASRVPTMGINGHYFQAIEHFMDCAPELEGSRLYTTDAIAYGAMYLAAKADALLEQIIWAYVTGSYRTEPDTINDLQTHFLSLLQDCDSLLSAHPIYRLERWEEMAARTACTTADSLAFQRELRRLVTVWGGPNLSDYSCRLWSGLIHDFYIPRWQKFFTAIHDIYSTGSGYPDFRTIEEKFPITVPEGNTNRSSKVPDGNLNRPLAEQTANLNLRAADLVKSASDIPLTNPYRPEGAFGFISRYDFSKPLVYKTMSVLDEDFRPATAIEITHIDGKQPLKIREIRFTSHNDRLGTLKVGREIGPGESVEIALKCIEKLPELAQEIYVQFVVEGSVGADASLVVKLL